MVLADRNVVALLEWAAGLSWDEVPQAARNRIALVVGDDIAAMLAASGEPEVRAVQEKLAHEARAAEATLLARGAPRVEPRDAALGNGLAASWAEMDEGYRKVPCHAGIYCLPALFAVAEKDGLAVREVLRAAVLAYEITARFARAWHSIIPPLHPHGLFNSVGAAAAVGLARGLEARTLVLAVTGAATMVSPGPYNHAIKGALVRNAWPALGALAGMLAVDLAAAGIGGVPSSPRDVFEGCFGAKTDAAQLVEALGRDWAVCDGYHKLYACCQYSHSALDALAELLARRPELKGGERVAAIEVETHPRGMTLDNYEPATALAAKFSLPHAMAAALAYGDAGVEAFSAASLAEARVARLRSRVRMALHPDLKPWPRDRPARVTLVLEDGERISASCESARGGPDRPIAEEEIRAKIRSLSAPIAPRLPAALERLCAEPEFTWRQWIASIFEG
jgi:2-methylcitrate dehydratase PrpD